MPTLANLVEDTIAMFSASTGLVEQMGTLQVDISDSDLSLVVDDPSMLGRGIYEIGDELVFATQGDTLSNTLTLAPFGRGLQGTTPAAHSAGAMITRAPRVPRSRAKFLISQAIRGLFPDLYAVKSDESNFVNLTNWGYPLPADVADVLDVQYKLPPFGDWVGVRRWRLDPKSDTNDFPSGYSLAIGEGLWPGSQLKVVYKARPALLVNDSDDFAAVTGLPDSASDLPVLWACERLVAADELLRTQSRSIEQSQRSQISPAGAAANASRLMHQQYTERLDVEKRALQERYNAPRIVRTWT